MDNKATMDVVVNIKHADKVLRLIKENSKTTTAEMAKLLTVITRAIGRIVSRLIEEIIIIREGAKKMGSLLAIL